MSLSRKQALNELQTMFPSFDRSALDSLLRANGNPFFPLSLNIDNLLNQTIEYILTLDIADAAPKKMEAEPVTQGKPQE